MGHASRALKNLDPGVGRTLRSDEPLFITRRVSEGMSVNPSLTRRVMIVGFAETHHQAC